MDREEVAEVPGRKFGAFASIQWNTNEEASELQASYIILCNGLLLCTSFIWRLLPAWLLASSHQIQVYRNQSRAD